MTSHKKYLACVLVVGVVVLGVPVCVWADLAEIERISKTGATLSAAAAKHFGLREQRVRGDTGINVLIDLSHQANFFTMWSLPRMLRARGFRAVGSQAALDTVVVPGSLSRVRVPAGRRRPFAWWPNPRYNVVIAFQADPRAQRYLPEEIAALKKFVGEGGGLVLLGGSVRDKERLARWPLNKLAGEFGAQFTSESDVLDGARMAVVSTDEPWRAISKGRETKVVIAARHYGNGRVLIVGSVGYFERFKDQSRGNRPQADADDALATLIELAAEGSEPIGGPTQLPTEAAGGGPIYPESSKRIGNVVVYYAKNQNADLLECVEKDMPLIKSRVEGWLPSPPPDEPMNLILSAGGGGGWAVNAYLPKEVGIISLTKSGVLSVFAHELAHTMSGPVNDMGEAAGNWPQGNQGESHAGWFQGKAAALATGKRVSHQPNKLFDFDKDATELDLALPQDQMREKWGKGKEWTKVWWVWQKLDDRYGPTWYPRWRWVQYTRWQEEPNKRLSWDETVEDMSIAVGEDLFPFFRKIGTTLEKDRLAEVKFMGKMLKLPVAPMDTAPAGSVRLEAIGDFKNPLSQKRP